MKRPVPSHRRPAVAKTRVACPGWRAGFVAAALALAAAAQAAAPGPLVQAVPGASGRAEIGPGWRLLTLPQQKPPVTRYSAEMLDGQPVLRIDAQASYGNLGHAMTGPSPAQLRWSWRVDRPNPATNLRSKAGDDSAAKVCISFDLPLDSVPFFERELLRLARTRSPEPLPAATLCWVWGHAEAIGAVVPNAYSKRVRYIVLRGQGDSAGRWVSETRDVHADFLAAFGDESTTVPPAVALLVSGDADNTGASSLAYVAGLQFVGAALPAAPAIPAAGR